MVNAEIANSDRNLVKDNITQNSKIFHLERSRTAEFISEHVPPVKMARSNSLPITPQKVGSIIEEPLTPTANLKMLVSAAESVQQKRELFQDDEDVDLEDSCSTISDLVDEKQDEALGDEKKPPCDGLSNSRKLKSLGLLCKKFLCKYPDGLEGAVINLHEVAKELNVERRRIYDIVNVLESLEYVTKKGKNTYNWHGSGRLIPTLRKLKALAEKVYHDSKEELQDKQNSENIKSASQLDAPPYWLKNAMKTSEHQGNSSIIKQDDDHCRRRNKSLGIFCQKLIMLFMVSKNHVIALDDAAKEVIEIDEEKIEKNSKTKVRRLYDIANILSSMGLIEKTQTYFGSRKAAFKWIGVDLDSLQPDTETVNGETEFMPTKHSLFSQPSSTETKHKQGSSSLRKLEARSFSAGNIDVKKRNKMPRTKSAATIVSRKRPSNDTPEEEERKPSRNTPIETNASGDYLQIGGSLAGSINSSIMDDSNGKENMMASVESPIRASRIESDEVSPNERCFREEVRKLQQRFPQKFQNTGGLLHLQRAGNELQKGIREDRGKCNLLRRIRDESDLFVPGNLDSTIKSSGVLNPTQRPVDEVRSKKISKSCFDLIMDEVRSKETTMTLRHGIQSGIEDSRNRGLYQDIRHATAQEGKVNQPWKCYPYHVSQTVQKASVGVQASLLDDVSPLKPLSALRDSPKRRKRDIEDSDLVTSQVAINGVPSSCTSSSKSSLRIPVYSSTNGGVSTSVSKCDIRSSSSYFFLEFKPPKKVGQSAVSSSVKLHRMPLKVATNDANATTSSPQTMPKVAKNDGVITMVPIPPTPFEMGEDKENREHSQGSIFRKGQHKAVASPARILLPLQVLNGDSKGFTSPVLLPKVKGGVLMEETPIRSDPKDRTKAQRNLSNFAVADK